jgi:hypothetical protein
MVSEVLMNCSSCNKVISEQEMFLGNGGLFCRNCALLRRQLNISDKIVNCFLDEACQEDYSFSNVRAFKHVSQIHVSDQLKLVIESWVNKGMGVAVFRCEEKDKLHRLICSYGNSEEACVNVPVLPLDTEFIVEGDECKYRLIGVVFPRSL